MGRAGTMQDHAIQSSYLNEEMKLKVYLPENFSPLYKYHICIMQDGNDYYQMGRVATLSDKLHEQKQIESTIFVGIHYKDRYDRQDKYHPNGEKQAAYIKFLVNEVAPFLDDEFPGYHMGSGRTLMGDSLGGTVSLMTAIKYPNIFGNVVMQSPFVNDAVMNAVKGSKDLASLAIYHTIGDQETEVETTNGDVKDFLKPNRELRDYLNRQPSTYIFHELEGDHTWKYWQQDMERVLLTMFGS
ncbi:alpha/beta hydrolase [Thalassobacillus pellis]|uniref:alpha/beta hydrolase n=1 Tax=Thalassobacillus pellis TaxID=748008 RepID=UPI00195FECAC|nr:alpha/beta hydrolase-fold protein [Thalassobacillus pellis]MBM7553996.1 enterochelin esterase-like enzyme [Thalassobacillus pellis]